MQTCLKHVLLANSPWVFLKKLRSLLARSKNIYINKIQIAFTNTVPCGTSSSDSTGNESRTWHFVEGVSKIDAAGKEDVEYPYETRYTVIKCKFKAGTERANGG